MIRSTFPFRCFRGASAAIGFYQAVFGAELVVRLAFAAPAMAAPGSTSGMGEALTAEARAWAMRDLLAGSPLLAEVQREQLLRRLEEAA